MKSNRNARRSARTSASRPEKGKDEMEALTSEAKARMKSFWNRPEGTTGMIFTALLLVLGGFALYRALPFIITLLENTLQATLLGAALFVVLYVLFNRRFQTLASYGFQSLMRAVTSIFITIDPIGILKGYVTDLRKNLSTMGEQISNLSGQIEALQNAIGENKRRYAEAVSLAGEARKRQKQSVVVLKARMAGRLEKSNRTLEELLGKMESLLRVLRKMYEVSDVMVQDVESEVDVRTRERAMIRASYSAMRSAMRILRGETDKRAVFDQTMQALADDYGQKLGEIRNFVEMSQGFIDSVDVENGVYEERALEMLERWEKEGDSLLLGNEKGQLLLAADSDPSAELEFSATVRKGERVPVRRTDNSDSGYEQLFK